MTAPVLAIVIPCYNEQEVLPETMRRLDLLLDELQAASRIAAGSKVWFVDDGSRDRTWAIIEEASQQIGSRFGGFKLSRNRGHQIALLAGLMQAPGDVLISVDADLQDDLDAIRRMLEAHAQGHDLVYGVRSVAMDDIASMVEHTVEVAQRMATHSRHNAQVSQQGSPDIASVAMSALSWCRSSSGWRQGKP